MPVLIAPTGSRTVPYTYTLSQLEDFVPTSITASFDGTGAGGPWVPCVSYYSQDGLLLARCPLQQSLAAGDVAEVTFAPFLRPASNSPGPWHYATPLAPAPTPGDFSASDSLNAPFVNGWLNGALPDGTFSPLRWRLLEPRGDIELVGVIDGGAVGTTVVTLPASMRPLDDAVGVVGSADGTSVFTVAVSASTGVVVVISSVPVSSGATGPASGDLAGTYPAPTVKNVSQLTTKGDLLVGAGGAVTARLPVGADTFVLVADSAQTDGVKWAANPGGAPSGPAGGDLAGTYPNPTLNPIGAAAGPIGDATHVAAVTIDTKGRVTALSSVAIGGISGTGLVSLFDSTLGVAAASIDTGAGGIAAGHKDLLIMLLIRTADAGTNGPVGIRFNNDSGANYDYQNLTGLNTTTSAAVTNTGTSVAFGMEGDGGGANYAATAQFWVPSYDQTTFFKSGTNHSGRPDQTAANMAAGIQGWGWRSTAAITRVSVTGLTANLKAGCRMAIYGTA